MNVSLGLRATSRRELLRVGMLALGGLSLPQVLAAREASGNATRDTAVILLFLNGGASQLETYDLKPDAPSSYRSVFRPIATSVPGVSICEHLPRQARIAEKLSLVRSLNHDIGIHSDGGILVLTGKRPSRPDPTSKSVSEHPDFASVASRLRGMPASLMPPYVSIPKQLYMTRPSYLGMQHASFAAGDPAVDNYASPLGVRATEIGVQRLDGRLSLRARFDRLRGDLDLAGNLQGVDKFRDLAMNLLLSPRAATAFDLEREDARLRDRYGRNAWGQACLLARRLAEAGTTVISVSLNTPQVGPEFTNWDDHYLNAGRPGHFAQYMETRFPYYDQAVAALIEDVFERRLDRQILIVAVSEFGRTPKLSVSAGGAGRDHWPQAYSALISGGGLRMGEVVGATNSKSEYPTERPTTPQDLLATIYRHLGIDGRQTLLDFSGRPVQVLAEGLPIAELI